MWPFARRASGPGRCQVYFRTDATFVLTQMGVAPTLWLAADPWVELTARPTPQALGQAVLKCLKASRMLGGNALVKSGFSRRFPDWDEFREGTRAVQVERRDGKLTLVPTRNTEQGFAPLPGHSRQAGDSPRELGEAILGSSRQAEIAPQTPPSDIPDRPLAFGRKCCWLAVPAGPPEKLARALGLRWSLPCNWHDGLERATLGRGVFVTPPVSGWCLAVGEIPSPAEEPAEDPALLLVGELSQKFGQAQLFASDRGSDTYAWARAKEGSIERAFATGELEWRMGKPTPEEQELNFRFFDPTSPEAARDEYWNREDLSAPDEECVLQVARLWSLNPDSLQNLEAGGLGLWGRLR